MSILAKLFKAIVKAGIQKGTGLVFDTQVLPGTGWIASAIVGKVIDILDQYIERKDQTSRTAQRAKDNLLRGDDDTAIAELSELIRLDHKSAWAYYMRGLIYLHKAM